MNFLFYNKCKKKKNGKMYMYCAEKYLHKNILFEKWNDCAKSMQDASFSKTWITTKGKQKPWFTNIPPVSKRKKTYPS